MYRLILIIGLIKLAFIVEEEPGSLNCFIGLVAIISGAATWLYILSKLGNKK